MNGRGASLQIRLGTAGCLNYTLFPSTTNEKELIVLKKRQRFPLTLVSHSQHAAYTQPAEVGIAAN